LIDHVLLVRTELASLDLLEVRVRRSQHLVGSVPLVGRLVAGCAPRQLNARL
jgi:hypothetical protein